MSEKQTTEEILARLRETTKDMDELQEQLKRSLRIEKIWPAAFLNGQRCSPVLIGTNRDIFKKGDSDKVYHAVDKYPPPYQHINEVKYTYLKRSDGVKFPITPEEFFSIFED